MRGELPKDITGRIVVAYPNVGSGALGDATSDPAGTSPDNLGEVLCGVPVLTSSKTVMRDLRIPPLNNGLGC